MILCPQASLYALVVTFIVFLPHFSPCGGRVELVRDFKPDHKGDVCGFWLSDRVVCVLRFSQDSSLWE